MKTYNPPIVPNELTRFLTEDVLETHAIFSQMTSGDIRLATKMHMPDAVFIGDRSTRPVIIEGDPEAGISVFAFSHQQALKPSTMLRLLVHRAVNNPEGITIGLPNNSVSDYSYIMTDGERSSVASGNMQPFYELQTKTVETVVKQRGDRGKVTLNGYSLGGLTALGIASVGSPSLDVVGVTAIEAPNKTRTKKELRDDFRSSGTLGSQRKAIADANLPALRSILSFPRLMLDYTRFGLATLAGDNAAIEMGMTSPEFTRNEGRALEHYGELVLRLGSVKGSKLFDPNFAVTSGERIVYETYSGAGAHGHATGDNPFALALMMRSEI
jgi:hypothetical protein